MTTNAASARPERTAASHLISDLAASLEEDRISVGELLKRLEGRGLGILLLILSLPMCIPNIPGISTLFGILLIAPSIQMISGHRFVWMPPFVCRWRFKGESLRRALTACAKLLRKIEHLAKPRLSVFTSPVAIRLMGFQTLIMALVLILPMPGANLIPGIAVVLTGLGILQKDGGSMLASVPVAVGALVWVYFGFKYTIDFMMWLYRSGLSFFSSLA